MARWTYITPIRVVMEAETVTLRGVVQTAHDRVLAEQLALLEPGVRRVRNELTVGPVGPAPSGPAAATDLPEVPEAPELPR